MSFEIGACFIPVPTHLALDDAEMQVLAALRAQRLDIIAAERTFRVDRRAIAGAIAWEMLENVRSWSPLSRVVGWGKLHCFKDPITEAYYGFKRGGVREMLKGFLRGFEFDHTLAKEVEDRGYLPKQSYENRKAILATPDGAIQYIAASMAAIADMASKYGFTDIHGDPVILTNVYQGHTLATWEEHLQNKPKGSSFVGGNEMDIWVGLHLPFLEDAVGKPELPGVAGHGTAP